MLSDTTIRAYLDKGRIDIHPVPDDRAFQPASVDLRLGPKFVLLNESANPARRELDAITLNPGDCALAGTAETLSLPDDIVARVEGKSSWGRQFLMVHSTAGFIDPGFTGIITLELKNLGPHPLRLTVGCYIAQVSFERLDEPADRPYGHWELGSRYQNQPGATPARPEMEIL